MLIFSSYIDFLMLTYLTGGTSNSSHAALSDCDPEPYT